MAHVIAEVREARHTCAMDIRPYRPADRAALIALWQACKLVVAGANDPEFDIDFAVNSADAEILIGAQGGRVVASAMVGHDGHRGWLYYVAVEPSLQGTGLGRDMVAAGEAWLKARGAPKAQLMIRDTNVKVEAFYARLGYKTIPRLVMQKVLP
jgi:ribosomal protein S18 acetylase RimI-like enzyme